MLTPANFIFNDELSPQYVEFNYSPQESLSTYGAVASEYSVKVSNDSQLTVKDFTIDNYGYSYGSTPGHEYYNISFSQTLLNSINSLKRADAPSSEKLSLLFPGVRHLAPGIIVFERPPTHKVVSTYNDYRDAINKDTSTSEYYLPIPWQVYIAMYNPQDMRLVSVKMFFTSSTLTSFDQELYAPPLYNFYSNGTLCRPFFSNMEDIEKYPKDLSGVIASAYDWIWNSGFNFDITENISFFLLSKKFKQFEQYITPERQANYQWLEAHSVNSLPMQLPSKYSFNFLNCWEDIPLSKVSSISWCSYTPQDFYYQYQATLRDQLIDSYIDDNSFVIHENVSDEEYHDDDCQEDCLHMYEINESASYNKYILEFIDQQSRSLREAITSSTTFLNDHRLLLKPHSKIQANKAFLSILENCSFTS